MPNVLPYCRRVRQFAKLEASHAVCVALDAVVTLPDGREQVSPLHDEYATDMALQEHAEARGRTTWDEDDICALLDCERGPAPVVVLPPVPSTAPAAA